VVTVHLYRPWSVEHFLAALPQTVRSIAVLDRVKEPGSTGDPLYLDVVASLWQGGGGATLTNGRPTVIGGRYGLGSKEFDPSCVKAVFDELDKEAPKDKFTVGIVDDLSGTSLELDSVFDIEPEDRVRAVFFGLGADGTVGANKNSIKIIGEETENEAQGFFVYDSKKSGAATVSHLRFGKSAIRAPYLIKQAGFVACHQLNLLEKRDVLSLAKAGATLLLNTSPYEPSAVWQQLAREVQQEILEKKLEVWAIDAQRVAEEAGLGRRINTVMQVCFFAISGVLPREEAIARIKDAIEKTYGKRGAEVVRRNFEAVDSALAHLQRLEVPDQLSERSRPAIVAASAPDFVQKVTAVMIAGKGDHLPVSAFPPDGTWPVGTAAWEKRRIAVSVPIWDPEVCIQCNQCALACPHAAIRTKVYEVEALSGAPESFRSDTYRAADLKGMGYTVQVAPEDCTGCSLCTEVCPAKDRSNPRRKAINMEPLVEHLEEERENFDFFLALPELDRRRITRWDAKSSQLLQPLFEFSGACAGCGETPYVKLLTQLYGSRLLIANATGCSSIYGGNLPTTPYAADALGRGPAWSNSLFEDNAEFGLGMRLAVDSQTDRAVALLLDLAPRLEDELVEGVLNSAGAGDESSIVTQRERVEDLRRRLKDLAAEPAAKELDSLADYLVKKSVWLVGGDGWAYDIGYGGLDHVLGSGRDVNILVLDTEVYSNTGGQQSKATPLGAAAKFAAAGKELGKKNLALEAMSYGNVYVAQIAFGAKINQTVQALHEADAFPGPSLVIAFSPCIAHGYDLAFGAEHQKLAMETGFWPIFRYDPRLAAEGKPPLNLDMPAPKRKVREYMETETRFRMVEKIDRNRYQKLLAAAQSEVERRYAVYTQLAGITVPSENDGQIEEGGRNER
ncbi:MAG TPA: pyruvate:ferredoxin (flavodoxin) oxidoreductase, partial [Thermoanaerobaculia bacterium]|nr:pyruvate:ferredoxin (flavodoxin) oxidoreductase [Thermoanaerobaculia bacterium]